MHFAVEIAPGRGKDPHVDPLPRRRAYPADLGLLERAEELRLQGEIEIANLVEKERAAVGLFEEPFSRGIRPCERPPLVAEELRLDERRGDRGAIEDDEGAAAPRTGFVERLGDRLFPGPGLPFDEHRDVARGEAREERIQAAHLRARANHAMEARVLGRGEDVRGPIQLDPKRRRPQLDDRLRRQIRIADAHAVHPRAVRRVEVEHVDPHRVHVEGGVPARHRAVLELHVAGDALSEEHAARGEILDRELRPHARSRDDDQRAPGRRDGAHDGGRAKESRRVAIRRGHVTGKCCS